MLWKTGKTRIILVVVAVVFAVAVFRNVVLPSNRAFSPTLLSNFKAPLSGKNASSDPSSGSNVNDANDSRKRRGTSDGGAETSVANGMETEVQTFEKNNSTGNFSLKLDDFRSPDYSSVALLLPPPSKYRLNSPAGEEKSLSLPPSLSPVSNFSIKGGPPVKNSVKQPPKVMSLSDMNDQLLKNRVSSRSKVPLWPSEPDRQMLKAKARIENSRVLESDRELYSPVFRNLSTFKRSYDLMEQVLKVYIYKEGEKPVFHDPSSLTGIYATETWFMKQMEENSHFVTDDPAEAHLFYIPYSSRALQLTKYIANSHSHEPLIQLLRDYVRIISSKYPFWNRTAGSDHFLVACHDWSTYETGVVMEESTTIRALCTADTRQGFKIGNDVSLPQTNVRLASDPHRNVGGLPTPERTNLAFFAGRMHGHLRAALLQYWENRDPDMKVFNTIRDERNRVAAKPYRDYMKSSKYCICPRGYEVNSPRVVEALFYGCVPVIVSDDFVPPLFEVLDWEAFSVMIPEKDVPRLKELLVSIPEEKYLALQMGVRQVQKHFLWNKKPLKYDLFHMILHSVWFNRLYQIQK